MPAHLHQKVLLLGPTGVDKAGVAQRLTQHLASEYGHSFKFIDFEKDYLKNHLTVKSWPTFLAQDISQQAHTWRRAWEQLKGDLTNEPVLLGLHATYVSGIVGLRSAINIPSICEDFRPSLVVTLIDDVFSMWSRTEARAEGSHYKGRPTFEQLLVARRAEQVLGDLILTHTPSGKCRHVLCATGNSLSALINLIVFDAPITYLSFPISAPRELEGKGDKSFIELINEAHRLAQFEMQNAKRAFISPLAIDELPLLERLKEHRAEVQFDCTSDRWPLAELWGADANSCSSASNVKTFPRKQIEAACGLIKTDVGWRDRRLVLQSDSLAIVCPKPPNEDRITRGVREEIETAIPMGIVCRYWQNPDWDPEDYVGKQFPPAGSMGLGHTQALVERMMSLDKLILAHS